MHEMCVPGLWSYYVALSISYLFVEMLFFLIQGDIFLGSKMYDFEEWLIFNIDP